MTLEKEKNPSNRDGCHVVVYVYMKCVQSVGFILDAISRYDSSIPLVL